MKLARPDNEDFQALLDFMNAAEQCLEGERYSMQPSASAWKRWDDGDPDKIKLLKLRKSIADSEGIDEKYVDDRILMYEYLESMFTPAAGAWRRVYWTADVLLKNCCDPTITYVDWAPGIEINHVEKEQ